MKYLAFIFLLSVSVNVLSQEQLLTDMRIQMECTEAVDSLYNFNFEVAEKQFSWLKQQYPEHPLAYFLLGLSEWWKIMPNDQVEKYDEKFYAYMDTTIDKAKDLYDEDKTNAEATFFLAGAHGFKSRRLSDHGQYGKAAFSAKASLNYLNEHNELQQGYEPEFLFGTALYNYFREWIPDNKKFLKPIVMFFPKGDKAKGLDQLKTVAKEAFYTRVEALIYLMKIYGAYEDSAQAAYPIAEYLYQQYPDNAYLHRYLAKTAFYLGKRTEAYELSKLILKKIDLNKTGYESESGRIASYIIASHYRSSLQITSAKVYYKKCLQYGNDVEAQEKGYYLSSLYYLGKYAEQDKSIPLAKYYYEYYKALEPDKKKSRRKYVRRFLRENRKVESITPEGLPEAL